MNKRSTQARTTVVGRDLETVHRFAQHLLAEHGRSDWSVYWAETIEEEGAGGVTRAHSKRIVLSAANLAILSSDGRRDAVRHEVAHAIVGVGEGHSTAWQEMATQLGGTGADTKEVSWTRYPWYGLCPDEHPFVSVRSPGPDGFTCQDSAHDDPVPLKLTKRNAKSLAFDPGVKKMVDSYPEPVSSPAFAVGATVYVVPYGSGAYDNARATVTAISERAYTVELAETGEEIDLAFEGASAQPV